MTFVIRLTSLPSNCSIFPQAGDLQHVLTTTVGVDTVMVWKAVGTNS